MSSFEVKNLKELATPMPRGTMQRQPCGACAVRHMALCAVLEPDELSAMSSMRSKAPW